MKFCLPVLLHSLLCTLLTKDHEGGGWGPPWVVSGTIVFTCGDVKRTLKIAWVCSNSLLSKTHCSCVRHCIWWTMNFCPGWLKEWIFTNLLVYTCMTSSVHTNTRNTWNIWNTWYHKCWIHAVLPPALSISGHPIHCLPESGRLHPSLNINCRVLLWHKPITPLWGNPCSSMNIVNVT